MSKANNWREVSDEDLKLAEENLADDTEEGQRGIIEEINRRRKEVHIGEGGNRKKDGIHRKQAVNSVYDQMEGRYQDAYRVARTTVTAAEIIKFFGMVILFGSFLVAFLIKIESTMVRFSIIIVGGSAGVLLYGIGILVSAQGQQLLATIDDVIGSSPFLSNGERAKIMGVENVVSK